MTEFVNPRARTEAKGFLTIERYLATRSQVLAQARTSPAGPEAKGFLAISQYLGERRNVSPAGVQVVQPGFDWGDVGIGAAITAGIFLLGSAAALVVRRRHELAHLHH